MVAVQVGEDPKVEGIKKYVTQQYLLDDPKWSQSQFTGNNRGLIAFTTRAANNKLAVGIVRFNMVGAYETEQVAIQYIDVAEGDYPTSPPEIVVKTIDYQCSFQIMSEKKVLTFNFL